MYAGTHLRSGPVSRGPFAKTTRPRSRNGTNVLPLTVWFALNETGAHANYGAPKCAQAWAPTHA